MTEVQLHGLGVMRHPRVRPVMWGHFFATNPDAVAATAAMLKDLVGGSYMDGLAQYGVGTGTVEDPIVVPIDTADEPQALSKHDLEARLFGWITEWITGGTLAADVDSSERLYFIFPPTPVAYFTDDEEKPPAFHYHSSFPGFDFYWAAEATAAADRSSASIFAYDLSFLASHELVEACTDKDLWGFFSPEGEEIADICELKGGGGYKGLAATAYWSNWDGRCIRGDNGVSVRSFLAEIGVDASNGLKQLGTTKLDVAYIADRMFADLAIRVVEGAT